MSYNDETLSHYGIEKTGSAWKRESFLVGGTKGGASHVTLKSSASGRLSPKEIASEFGTLEKKVKSLLKSSDWTQESGRSGSWELSVSARGSKIEIAVVLTPTASSDHARLWS